MNDAHFHLLVNHFPIIGLLIGILVLISGLILKKASVQGTALGIFIFSAIGSIFAFYTGEGAEEVVENLVGVSETLIHTHEEYAETFFITTLILGALSLTALIAMIKNFKFSKHLIILCLIVALADGVLAKYVGTSGGEIRHTEIRNGAQVLQLEVEDDD